MDVENLQSSTVFLSLVWKFQPHCFHLCHGKCQWTHFGDPETWVVNIVSNFVASFIFKDQLVKNHFKCGGKFLDTFAFISESVQICMYLSQHYFIVSSSLYQSLFISIFLYLWEMSWHYSNSSTTSTHYSKFFKDIRVDFKK